MTSFRTARQYFPLRRKGFPRFRCFAVHNFCTEPSRRESLLPVMDSFTSSPSPSSLPSSEAVMDSMKAHLAQAYAEKFFSTVREKCFTKCVAKPSSSLSSSESSCVSRCVERYIEATGIVSKAIFQAVPR